jgi:hypothetical protein
VNPNHDVVNPVAGVPATIPNPGIPIGHLTDKKLMMLRFYYFNLDQIQRPFVVASSTLPILSECFKLQEQHEKEDDGKVDLPNKYLMLTKFVNF